MKFDLLYKLRYLRNYLSGLVVFWLLLGWMVGFLGLSLVFLAAILATAVFSRNKITLSLAILIGFGVSTYQANLIEADLKKGRTVAQHLAEKQNFKGVIVGEPEYDGTLRKYLIELEHKDAGKMFVEGPKWPEYQYGDVMKVSGRFAVPKNGLKSDFDYVGYLEKQNVFLVNKRLTSIQKLGDSKSFYHRFVGSTLAIKRIIIYKINQNLHEPHASLLSGIILGAKNSMPEDFAEKLRITGTTHIVAISGFNMTIIIEAVRKYGSRFFGKYNDFVAGLLVIWFGIMTGMSPPVLRAVIAAILSMLGRGFGRKGESFAGLLWTGFIMLLISPNLIWSISFQLSMGAVLGLMFWTDPLKRILHFIPESLEEGSIVTLAATLFTAPISFYYFKTISLISLVSNFFAIPVVGVTMSIGFGAVFLSALDFILPLSKIVFYLVFIPLDVFKQIVYVTANLKVLYFDLTELTTDLSLYVGIAYGIQLVIIMILTPINLKNAHRILLPL